MLGLAYTVVAVAGYLTWRRHDAALDDAPPTTTPLVLQPSTSGARHDA
jgi:hypothetical protein